MEASKAFYLACSRTLTRSSRCRRNVQFSPNNLTRSFTRRKVDVKTFSSSTQKQLPEDDSTPPSPPAPSSGPSRKPDDTPQPARSFRRQVDTKNDFISKYSSPAPPSFSASPESASSPSTETAPNEHPAERARKGIANLLDDVYGPIRDMVPPSTSSTQKPVNTFNPAIYDELAAYEAKPRSPRPLTDNPTFNLVAHLDAQDIARDHEASVRLRLKPTLGRTVPVNLNRNVDLTRAFRLLEFRNQANKVKQDEREQRFHVRKGQMAKIMRRRRWRVTFLAGYLKECERVRRMRRQGW